MSAAPVVAARCAVCGGGRFALVRAGCADRRHRRPGRFDVRRCADCGLAETTPKPSAESLLATYYPPGYVSFSVSGPARGRAARLLRAALRLPYRARYGGPPGAPAPPRLGSRALDVGCGSGAYLEQLAELGWEVWGVEPDRETARAAAERLGLADGRIVAATVETASFPAEHFDLVTMSHVLEHLHDPVAALCRVHGWLRPGGVLRLWLPNLDSLESRIFGRFWFGLDVPRHLSHFSAATVGLALARSGFEATRIVPELQASSLAGSLAQVRDAALRRRREYRHSRVLHRAVLPLGAVLAAAGSAATLDVTAERR